MVSILKQSARIGVLLVVVLTAVVPANRSALAQSHIATVETVHDAAVAQALSADDIKLTGDLASGELNRVLLYLLNNIGFIEGAADQADPPLVKDASLSLRNLKLPGAGQDGQTLVTFGELSLDGITIDANGSVRIRSIALRDYKSETLGSMFFNQPKVMTSQLQVSQLRILGLETDGSGQLGGGGFQRWPLKYRASELALTGLTFLERPIRSSKSAPQRETRSTLGRLLIKEFGQGSLGELQANTMSLRSNDGPNISLRTVSVSRLKTFAFSHLMSLSLMRNTYGVREEFSPRDTIAAVWPAGPLDFGLGGLDIRELQVRYEGVSADLDRLALITKKSRAGLINRLEVPRGSLVVSAQDMNNNSAGRSLADLIVGPLRLLKLDKFRLSWQALATFDGAQDQLKLERLRVVVDQLFQIDVAAQFSGVQNARNKLVAIDALDRFWRRKVTPRPTMNTTNPQRIATPEDEDNAKRQAEPEVQRSAVNAHIGAIRLTRLDISLADLGVLERFSKADLQPPIARVNLTTMTREQSKCHFADDIARRLKSQFAPSDTGALQRRREMIDQISPWLVANRTVQISLTAPIKFEDITKSKLGQPMPLAARFKGANKALDCRPWLPLNSN
jgi:hypothetical protein